MKALKRKRGRPKVENVIRETNGRISRQEDPPSKLALEVRAKLHRLTIDQAKDQQAGQWLGRLHMAYQEWRKKQGDEKQPEMSLSTGQYHALLTYQQLHNDRLKVISADGAYYERTGGAGLADDEAATRWAESVNKRYTAAREGIQAAQNYTAGNLWAALDLCVIQEKAMPHMLGDVRTLGNALKKVFGGVDG